MANPRRDDNEELRNRDLSQKAVSKFSREEKQELKRRFEEFVTVMRRSQPRGADQDGGAAKPVKWNPQVHGARGKQPD